MTVGLKNHTRCMFPVNEIEFAESALQIQNSKIKALDDSSQVPRAPLTPRCPHYAGSKSTQRKKKHPLTFSRLSYIENSGSKIRKEQTQTPTRSTGKIIFTRFSF